MWSPSHHRYISKGIRLLWEESEHFLFLCGGGSYSFSLPRRCRYQQTLFEKLRDDIAHEAVRQIVMVLLITDTLDREPFGDV